MKLVNLILENVQKTRFYIPQQLYGRPVHAPKHKNLKNTAYKHHVIMIKTAFNTLK